MVIIHPLEKDKIISAVNARVKRKAHKYGVAVPCSIEEAYSVDKKMETPSGDMNCIRKCPISNWCLIF